MDEKERFLRIKFSLVKGLGDKTFHDILAVFGTMSEMLSIVEKGESGIRINKPLRYYIRNCDEIDIDRFITENTKGGTGFVVYGDKSYPKNLMDSYNPPPILFYRGEIEKYIFDEKIIAVVGTRSFSRYGEIVTKDFVGALAESKYTTVSGMAYGIDRIVHEETLRKGGRTVAVLASNVAHPTPRGNTDIYNKIIDSGGLVLSEVPLGSAVAPHSFPLRNRIIAGLAKSTLVTEAGVKSGALITARVAFDEGRDVYAVPSDIGRNRFQGANRLISEDQARLVWSVDDLLDYLGYSFGVKSGNDAVRVSLSEDQKKIYEFIKFNPASMESLLGKFDICEADLLAFMSELEVNNVIRLDEMGRYFVI